MSVHFVMHCLLLEELFRRVSRSVSLSLVYGVVARPMTFTMSM